MKDSPSGAVSCPKCNVAMTPRTVGSVEIDMCPSCHGLWLDRLEKETLLSDPTLARKADAASGKGSGNLTPGPYLCPRDKGTLISLGDPRQPHVRYEQCTVCGGVFLDAGELKDLSEVTLRERLRMTLSWP